MKLRLWLASKVLGGNVTVENIEPIIQKRIEEARHEWIKQQLAFGNSITLEYKVSAIEEERKKRKKS